MRRHAQAVRWGFSCMALAGLTAAAPALADWSGSATLSTGPGNAVWPAVAMNARGDAAVAWYSGNGSTTEVSMRPAGAAPAASRTVSKAGEFGGVPSIALDGDGNAVVVFTGGSYDNPPEENGVKAAFVSAAGQVRGPLTIGTSTTGTINPTGLAMDAAGNAIAWWNPVNENHLTFAARPAGGDFGPPREIPNPGADVKRPELVAGANGHAVAAWASRTQVYAAIGDTRGAFAPAKALNAPIQGVMQPRVAVAPDGSAVVAWVDRPDERGNGFVRAAYRPAGGAFGPPQTLAEVFYTGVYDVSVAMAPTGEATVAWAGGTWVPRTEWQTTFAIRPVGGSFGPAREGMRTFCEEPPRLAYDAAGNTFSVCRRYYGQDEYSQPLGVLLAAVRPAGAAAFGEVRQLTPEGQNVWEPVLAAGGPGQAVTAWPRGWFPSRFRVEAAWHSGSVFAPPGAAAIVPPQTAPPAAAGGSHQDAPPANARAGSVLDGLLARLESKRAARLLRRLRHGPVRLPLELSGAGAVGLQVRDAAAPWRVLARGRVVVDAAGPATLVLRATRAGRAAAGKGAPQLRFVATLRLAGHPRLVKKSQ